MKKRSLSLKLLLKETKHAAKSVDESSAEQGAVALHAPVPPNPIPQCDAPQQCAQFQPAVAPTATFLPGAWDDTPIQPGVNGLFANELWTPTAWDDVFVSIIREELVSLEASDNSTDPVNYSIRRVGYGGRRSEAEAYDPVWIESGFAYSYLDCWHKTQASRQMNDSSQEILSLSQEEQPSSEPIKSQLPIQMSPPLSQQHLQNAATEDGESIEQFMQRLVGKATPSPNPTAKDLGKTLSRMVAQKWGSTGGDGRVTMDWTQLANDCQALAPAPPPPPSSADINENNRAEALDQCTDLPSPPPNPPPRRCSRLIQRAEHERDVKALSQESMTSSQEEASFGNNNKQRALHRMKKGKNPASAATLVRNQPLTPTFRIEGTVYAERSAVMYKVRVQENDVGGIVKARGQDKARMQGAASTISKAEEIRLARKTAEELGMDAEDVDGKNAPRSIVRTRRRRLHRYRDD